jgi:hypothetical protein
VFERVELEIKAREAEEQRLLANLRAAVVEAERVDMERKAYEAEEQCRLAEERRDEAESRKPSGHSHSAKPCIYRVFIMPHTV